MLGIQWEQKGNFPMCKWGFFDKAFYNPECPRPQDRHKAEAARLAMLCDRAFVCHSEQDHNESEQKMETHTLTNFYITRMVYS